MGFCAYRFPRIAVIGAGAIGSYVAAGLTRAGHRVTLCVRSPLERLVVETGGVPYIVPADILTSSADAAIADWVFIATKNQDTAGAAPWLKVMVGEKTRVVLLQNGVEGPDITRPLVGDATILPTIVYISAEKVSRGRVVHFFGDTLEAPQGRDADALADLLAPGGIRVNGQADFTTAAWRKLILNITLNPITALTMQRFGVFQEPAIQALAGEIIREAALVANAAGARFADADVADMIAHCARLNPQGGTSMLYDRMAGKRLEYEYLNGSILRYADRFGLAVPYNRAIYALIGALDQAIGAGLPATAAANDAHADTSRVTQAAQVSQTS